MNLKYYFDVKMRFLPLDGDYFEILDKKIQKIIFKSTTRKLEISLLDPMQSLLVGLVKTEHYTKDVYETRRLS